MPLDIRRFFCKRPNNTSTTGPSLKKSKVQESDKNNTNLVNNAVEILSNSEDVDDPGTSDFSITNDDVSIVEDVADSEMVNKAADHDVATNLINCDDQAITNDDVSIVLEDVSDSEMVNEAADHDVVTNLINRDDPIHVNLIEHDDNLVEPKSNEKDTDGSQTMKATDFDIGEILLGNYEGISADQSKYCTKLVDSLDDQTKYKILSNHFTPAPNFVFPKKQNGGCQRSCRRDYLDSNYVYSKSQGGVFCLACTLFTSDSQQGQKRSNLGIFVNSACSNWRKFWDQKATHDKTQYHKQSLFEMDNLKRKIEKPKETLPVMVNKELQQRYESYMNILEIVAKTVHLSGKQCIALRGSHEKLEVEESGNSGNFLTIIKLLAQYIPELENHLNTAKNKQPKTTYLSPQTQNEMINVIGIDMIQAELIKEIKDAGFHSVMCDEVTSSNDEIMSLCFRFVDKNKDIREVFVDFVAVDRITGKVLSKSMLEFYEKHGIDICACRGQSYDGAGNMSSQTVGVSARIREVAPLAFYTHCCSHRLNLSLGAAMKVDIIQNTMETMKNVNLYFFLSPKRQKVLEAVVNKANLHPTQRKTLVGLCKTRWTERDIAFEHAYLALPFVVEALEIISGNHEDLSSFPQEIIDDKYDSESKKNATAYLKAVTSFDYVIGVVSLYQLMHPLKGITQKLQGRSMDIVSAYNEIEDVKQVYIEMRENVETSFSKIYDQSVRIADKIDVTVEKPRTAKRQKNRDNQPSDTIEEYFKRALAIPLLDNLIMELNVRFDSVAQTVIKLLNLIPSICAEEKRNDDFQLQDLVDLYEADLPNPALVEVEYDIWIKKWKRREAEDRPDTLATSIKQMDELIFPNLFILMKIACTLPVTSCECERSFSCLRRLRTWLRASMGMPRLSALALMNIHYDWKIDYRKAADLFMKLHPRKINQPSLFFA